VPRRTALLIDSALCLVAGAVFVGAVMGPGRPVSAAAQVTVVTVAPTTRPSVTLPKPTLPPNTTVPRTVPPTTATTKAAPPTTVRHVHVPRTFYIPAPVITQPAPTTTSTSTTSTTIAAIGGLPVAPATLPLHTKGTSAHVDPLFAILSGAGFLLGLLIIVGRVILSRPPRGV
jgi:hypothetical protein